MIYNPNILYINEERFAKGCYHYYDNYMKIGYTIYFVDQREARRKLRTRYPHINAYRVKFIKK